MNQIYTNNLTRRLPVLTFITCLLCFPAVKSEAQERFENLRPEERKIIERCLSSETDRLMKSASGVGLLKELQEEGVTCKGTGMDIVYQEVMNKIAVPAAKTCLKGKLSEAFLYSPFFQISYQQIYATLCARLEESARRSPGQVNKHSLQAVTPPVGNCPLLSQDELTTIMTHQSPRRKVRTQNNTSGVFLSLSIDHPTYRNIMISAARGRKGEPAVMTLNASGFPGIPDPLNRVLYSRNLPIAQYVPNEKFSAGQFAACRDLIITLSDLLKK